MPILSYTINIDAPIEEVWAILTDFEAYDEWNKFTPSVETSGRIGEPVRLQVRLNSNENGRLTRSTLTMKKKAAYELCWGTDGFLLKANRYQTLTPLEDGRTQYESREPFEGLLAPLILWWHRENLMRGYKWAAEGLKERAEKRIKRKE